MCLICQVTGHCCNKSGNHFFILPTVVVDRFLAGFLSGGTDADADVRARTSSKATIHRQKWGISAYPFYSL